MLEQSIKSIAVFCGSKLGGNKLFATHAEALGKLMAQHNITLVYGGGAVGLMGIIANAVISNGGKVIGVLPKILADREVQHNSLAELHIVADMHIRKKMMYELCDAAIVLPGGYGTLDELFEIITWNNLKIHEKKVILLNSAGFYNHLINHLQVMQEQGYLYEDWQQRIMVAEEPEIIFSAF